MRWFKHMTCSSRDEKLLRLIDEFGLEGYGLFWVIIELIAEQCTPDNNRTFLELSPKSWRKVTGFSPKKFQKVVNFLATLGVFTVTFSEKTIRVESCNLLKFRDEYSKRKARKSGHTTDKVPAEQRQIQIQRQTLHIRHLPANDSDSASRNPACPHLKIVGLYNEILGPVLTAVKPSLWNGARKKNLATRWKEDPERQNLDWWRDFFHKVKDSVFLTGGSESGWVADLGWLVKPNNMVKVLEGKYDDRGKADAGVRLTATEIEARRETQRLMAKIKSQEENHAG